MQKSYGSIHVSFYYVKTIYFTVSLLHGNIWKKIRGLNFCWYSQIKNFSHIFPEWLVSGVVGMLWNGGGLGTGESDVSIVLLNSVLHESSTFRNKPTRSCLKKNISWQFPFSPQSRRKFWSFLVIRVQARGYREVRVMREGEERK